MFLCVFMFLRIFHYLCAASCEINDDDLAAMEIVAQTDYHERCINLIQHNLKCYTANSVEYRRKH